MLEHFRWLGRLELSAHEAGADRPQTWSALAHVYRQRPAVLAELAILENCGAADLIRFFSAKVEEKSECDRRRVDAGRILRLGKQTYRGFVNLKVGCSRK